MTTIGKVAKDGGALGSNFAKDGWLSLRDRTVFGGLLCLVACCLGGSSSASALCTFAPAPSLPGSACRPVPLRPAALGVVPELPAVRHASLHRVEAIITHDALSNHASFPLALAHVQTFNKRSRWAQDRQSKGDHCARLVMTWYLKKDERKRKEFIVYDIDGWVGA